MSHTLDDSKQRKYDERCKIAVNLIANNPEFMQLMKSKYLTDDILEDALDLNPDIFRYIKEPSMRIVLKALDIYGPNIQYIDDAIVDQIPEEVLINVLDSIDNSLNININFSGICEESRIDLFMNDPVKALSYGIQVPDYFILQELERQPNLIKLIKNPSNKMKCVALDNDPNVALYFDSLTDEMMDIIDAKYPHLKDSLSTYTRKG
jgi:hypothetical protein